MARSDTRKNVCLFLNLCSTKNLKQKLWFINRKVAATNYATNYYTIPAKSNQQKSDDVLSGFNKVSMVFFKQGMSNELNDVFSISSPS